MGAAVYVVGGPPAIIRSESGFCYFEKQVTSDLQQEINALHLDALYRQNSCSWPMHHCP